MSARVQPAPKSISDAAGLPWEIFICRACGLLYDEEKGDADSGLAPGTRFADIPGDWACPLCGVTKADFEPYMVEAPMQEARKAWTTRAASVRRDPGTVIVGAGRAGWQMAQALRARDADMPITIVTACNGDVYDKPLLSVALARGTPADKMLLETGGQAARRLMVRLLPNTLAIRINRGVRSLRTTRGVLSFRHLVIAHGAEPRTLPQFPATLCWRINHLEMYTKFRTALGLVSARIAVVGAGLVGSELANDLALAGHEVLLLDVATRPLANCLSELQSRQLMQAWAPLQLKFVGGVEVRAVTQLADAGGKELTTECGQVFSVDHVVVAAGLQTPHRLAASASLAWNNGIAVEPETLATSVPGIHALGDCISFDGRACRYIEPIGRQAAVLARNILDQPALAYEHIRVPLRVKTGSLPFTV